jgi:hypothetical protein
MNSFHIIHRPRPDATPDKVHDARTRAWGFVFDAHVRKNTADSLSTQGYWKGIEPRRIPLMNRLCPDKPNISIETTLGKDVPQHGWLIEAFVGSFGEEFVGCVSLDESRTRLNVYPGGALALVDRKRSLASGRRV